MKVKLLTTQQARNLHKRFDNWYEIQPIPITNGKWILTQAAGLGLKEWMIDKVDGNPNKKVRALQIWDFLKSLPTVDTDTLPESHNDYRSMFYNTSIDPDNATAEEQAELDEYIGRFSDLEFENIN